MNKKTFFNKGIYKAMLKRFWVGSVLYLVIMLLFVSLFDQDYSYHETIFSGMSLVGYYLSLGVAPVVAVLSYKFLHSKKNGLFIHSMPVTRCANYISSLLGSFTLMGVPALIMALILILSTGELKMGITWFLFVMLCNVVLFSVATFAAMLTGASWLCVVLYIASHAVCNMVATFAESLMEVFAAGYDYSMFSSMYNISIPVLLLDVLDRGYEGFAWSNGKVTVTLVLVAIAFYVLSWLLYKKRKMEKCEDASAFKAFNYILKYAVTGAVALFAFEMFRYELGDNLPMFILGSVILTSVSYFVTEMILKKKIKVWIAYKGYAAFVLVYTAILSFMAFTSVFGYETYVPQLAEIENAFVSSKATAVHDFSDRVSVEKLVDFHKEIMQAERKEIVNDTSGEHIFIHYYLTDGSTVTRSYDIKPSELTRVMNALYESNDFKREYERAFHIKPENITDIEIVNSQNAKIDADINMDFHAEFIEALQNDILNNNYTNLHEVYGGNYVRVRIKYLQKVEEPDPNEYTYTYEGIPEGYEKTSYTFMLNENYVNTIKFLEENGYEYMTAEEAVSYER